MLDILDKRAKLKLNGQLTYNENDTFRQALEQLEKATVQELTLDISEITFIDSAGLGMLLLMRDRLKLDRNIGLSGAGAQVRKILLLTKMDQLFTIL